MQISLVASLACSLLLWACGAQPQAASIDAGPSKADSTTSPAIAPAPADQGEWETLMNAEMVMYCVEYPKGRYEEDYDASNGKGHHVLVDKAGHATIEYSGNPTDMDLGGLYEAVLEDVRGMRGATLTEQSSDATGQTIVVRWEVGEEHHAFKKWLRAGEGETVTAHLTFRAEDAAEMAPIVAHIFAQDIGCE